MLFFEELYCRQTEYIGIEIQLCFSVGEKIVEGRAACLIVDLIARRLEQMDDVA